MFGGTKGKFNGLAFLLDDPQAPRGKPPPENFRRGQRANMGDDYYYDEDDMPRRPFQYDNINGGGDGKGPPYTRLESQSPDDDDYPPHFAADANRKYYFVTPPNDLPIIRVEENLKPEFRQSEAQDLLRQRRRDAQNIWQGGDILNSQDGYAYNGASRRRRNNNNNDEDWASKKVANWFRDDGDEADGYDGLRDDQYERPSGNRRGRSRQTWANPTDVLGAFFRMDKREMERQAEMYNQNMGIGPKRDRPADGPREERRKGYAYRYDVDDADDSPIVDADVIVSDVEETKEDIAAAEAEAAPEEPPIVKQVNETGSVKATKATTEEPPVEKRPNIPKQNQRQSQSRPPEQPRKEKPSRADDWEQRALARERIPPKVPAWGPNGDLGMDAQEKAYYDAVQEVSNGEIRLEQRKKQLEEAEERIEILKL